MRKIVPALTLMVTSGSGERSYSNLEMVIWTKEHH